MTFFWYGGGGVKFFCHTNRLSENIFQVKFICAQFSWPNIVGGYMREGVSLTQNDDLLVEKFPSGAIGCGMGSYSGSSGT